MSLNDIDKLGEESGYSGWRGKTDLRGVAGSLGVVGATGVTIQQEGSAEGIYLSQDRMMNKFHEIKKQMTEAEFMEKYGERKPWYRKTFKELFKIDV